MGAVRKLKSAAAPTAEFMIGRLILGIMDNDADVVRHALRTLETIGRRNMRGATLLTFVVGDVSWRSFVLVLDCHLDSMIFEGGLPNPFAWMAVW